MTNARDELREIERRLDNLWAACNRGCNWSSQRSVKALYKVDEIRSHAFATTVSYGDELATIQIGQSLPPQQPQKQYSTAEQLAELIPFAQRLGLYGAVDHLMKVTGQAGPLWGQQKVGEETV